MSLKKILSLGILLIVTAGVLSKDRAVSFEEIAESSTSEPNIMESNQTSVSNSSELNNIVNSQTKFALKLFQEIIKTSPQENTFISPFSVSVALSMLNNGAAGVTQKELSSLLEVMDLSLAEVNQGNQLLIQQLENSDSEINIAIANSLWTKKDFPLQQSFLDTNQEYYNTTVEQLDFAQSESVNTINNWVAENTQNKITQVVDQISPEQALFLINAIYFKGQWQNKFNPEQTTEQNFYLADGNTKQHPMMSNVGKYKYYENQDFQLLNLPYGSGRLGMNIFLPQKTSNLDKFFELLNSNNLTSWMQQMKTKEGEIQFPRFKQEDEADLNSILQQLGASSLFDASQANLAALSTQPVTVDKIKHKAVIEVNEEGTEAAAVTSIGIVATSVTTPFKMTVNRPFFYTIQDNETGAIIFMGTVQNPQE